MKKNYQKTLKACYLGFITQAIVANFAPLLFLKFHADYGISLGRIALISTTFYFTQLLVDLFCARFVDKIGYRRCVVASEVTSALGLAGLMHGKRGGIFTGTLIGSLGRFLVHYVVGATVWAEYMPESFFGMTMHTPWFYSLLYNLAYMLPNILICLLVFALLWVPMRKYLTGADLKKT